MKCAEARGQRPVLALDVMNDGRARPGQKRGDNKADAFARSGGRETENMLRSVVAQIVALHPSQHDAIRPEEACVSDLHRRSPPRRSIGFDILGFAGAPDGHADGDRDGNKTAGRCDVGAFDEDWRRVGVIGVPPQEEGGGQIDGHAARQLEPWSTKLGLEAEAPSRPLGRRPDCDEHDEKDDGDLTPQDLGGGQAQFLDSKCHQFGCVGSGNSRLAGP